MQEDIFSHKRLKNNRRYLASKTNELAKLSREKNVPVFWIRQEYSSDLKDAPINVQKNNIRIVISGTPGADVLSELETQAIDKNIIKKRYSAFYNTDLNEKLIEGKCTAVLVAGINSHACIRHTAIDAFQRDYEVLFASECIDSYDAEHHEITMKYMNKQIGKSVTNDQFSKLMCERT